jgi:hypothetical protein
MSPMIYKNTHLSMLYILQRYIESDSICLLSLAVIPFIVNLIMLMALIRI